MSSALVTSTTLRIFALVSNAQAIYGGYLTYVNRSEPGAVAGSHVLVHGLDGVRPGHFTVLLVHVVGAGARVVSDPDTKVLDLERVLLVDLQTQSVNRGLSGSSAQGHVPD